MQSHIVFTFMAPDKPGLLETLAAAVSRHGGSWLESKLARLGGQFTGIVRAAVPADKGAALRAELESLRNDHFVISLHAEEADATEKPRSLRSVEVLGNDRPGIVHELSRAFSKWDINVEQLNSEIRSAPMSAERLFEAEVDIAIPADLNSEQFEDELEQIANELDLDIGLK
ncbi:MAG: glycine cleavage system protein R [Pseudomonadales bacterium]